MRQVVRAKALVPFAFSRIERPGTRLGESDAARPSWAPVEVQLRFLSVSTSEVGRKLHAGLRFRLGFGVRSSWRILRAWPVGAFACARRFLGAELCTVQPSRAHLDLPGSRLSWDTLQVPLQNPTVQEVPCG